VQVITEEEYAAAMARGEELYRTTPHAVGARYDAARQRIVVELSNGMELTFSPRHAQGLEDATPEQLAEVQIDGVGFGLHWPTIDADLYVPSLLKGVTARRRGWRSDRLGFKRRNECVSLIS
jgi:hypothetical protein